MQQQQFLTLGGFEAGWCLVDGVVCRGGWGGMV